MGTASVLVVIAPSADDTALDACLAALDAATPAGTRVWLADDAQVGPRGMTVIQAWVGRTCLQAEYTRRPRPIGPVAHLDEALRACGDADVAVLAPDARPVAGWLEALCACFASDAAIATATPWCNAGETAAWPRIGEAESLPKDVGPLAAACTQVPAHYPELPAAVDHAVLLRARARQRAGGLDAASYASWYAALIDLSLRMSGLGWRNVLCDNAFVAREGEGGAVEGDVEALAARWPGWHERLANFLMRDPLHRAREHLRMAVQQTAAASRQARLFD